jgi:carbamate kinase
LLTQALHDELAIAHMDVPVVAMVTQTVVSSEDPAMLHPTKPIGPFYSRADAEERRRVLGWQIVEDAARGYRRVVPSPEPVEIIELEVIRDLVNDGVLVIACGGGGIPVVHNKGEVQGVEAVIDKDRASALLAAKLHVDVFAISTDTDYVYVDYKKPTQKPLYRVTASELCAYHHQGHFPPGNMGPKVESVLKFIGQGGKEAIITSYEHLAHAMNGAAGTRIIPDLLDAEFDLQTPSAVGVRGR